MKWRDRGRERVEVKGLKRKATEIRREKGQGEEKNVEIKRARRETESWRHKGREQREREKV